MPNRLLLAPLIALALCLGALAAPAADRAKVKAFMDVTGYDAVIEGLQQAAMAGPGLVGDAPQAFGEEYKLLAKEVFDPDAMKARALDILAAVMPDKLVAEGADFYASPLGQRLVKVENAAHLTPDAKVMAGGAEVVAKLKTDDPKRLEMLAALNAAVGSEAVWRKAAVEIQVHFILAARAAGALPQGPDETELRAMLDEQLKEAAPRNAQLAVVSNAYTYRDISDADLQAYLDELKSPAMSQIYEVLNATQYQVMIERYETLGQRLGDLPPQQEL